MGIDHFTDAFSGMSLNLSPHRFIKFLFLPKCGECVLYHPVYRLATPEEESVGIDGYVGNVPYSVKPDTYKTMGRLSETIAVKMIYYTKTKAGLTIEIED